jgi:hypothetical protein
MKIPAEFAEISKGHIRELILTHKLYTPIVIDKAIQEYRVYCEIQSVPKDNCTVLNIDVREQHRERNREIMWSFLTYLVSLGCLTHLREPI